MLKSNPTLPQNAAIKGFSLAGAAFGLASFAFTQDLDARLSEHERVIETARANASSSNIPIHFVGFGEPHQQKEFADIKIRGKLAHALYKKGAFLVILFKNSDDSGFSYSGEGAVVCGSKSGVVSSKAFNISSFSFYYARKSYDEYMQSPEDGGHKIVSLSVDSNSEGSPSNALKSELLGAVSSVMETHDIQSEPNSAIAGDEYFHQFKELVKSEALAKFHSLKNFGSVSSYIDHALLPGIRRYEALTKESVPSFLDDEVNKLKEELEKVGWINTSSLAAYPSAAWRSLHPDLTEIPSSGPASEEKLYEAIEQGFDIELRNLRKAADNLESALDILESQKNKIEEISASIDKIKKNPAVNTDLSAKYDSIFKELKSSINEPPRSFEIALNKFHKQSEELKKDLKVLEDAYKIAEAKRLEEERKAAILRAEEEERQKAWQKVKDIALGTLYTIGAIIGGIIVVIGTFLSGSSGGSNTLRDYDSPPRKDPDPFENYEPEWKRRGLRDPQSGGD